MTVQHDKTGHPNIDLRKYAAQTNFRLVAWFILLLFIVGIGLIWWFYGYRAALLGLFCLIGSALPVGLIAIFVFGLEFFVKKK